MTLSSAASIEAQLFKAGNSPTPGNVTGTASSKFGDDAKLRKAAGEFESILLNSMWKSMKETFSDDDDEDSDPTLKSFDEWGMQAMSSAVGNAGGLGIKNMIIKHLESNIGGRVPAGPSSLVTSSLDTMS